MIDWGHVLREGLSVPSVAPESSGRGVRVAVVDTGVNFEHPHLSLPAKGFGIAWVEGDIVIQDGQHRDVYGHGTCCAALIHLLAPEAELLAVQVTGDRATTDAERLGRGIEEAAQAGAAVICVAMGTQTRVPAPIEEAVRRALQLQAVVVAADPGGPFLPAACAGVVGVSAKEGVDVAWREGRVVAEGRARPFSLDRRNFSGHSLATARAAAAVARLGAWTGVRGAELVQGFKKSLIVL